MKLGIDIDDVLADFIPAFRGIALGLYPDHFCLYEEPVDWAFTNWKLTKEQMDAAWQKMFSIPNFFVGLDRKYYTSYLNELTQTHECWFITTRHNTGGVPAKQQSEVWLERMFGIKDPQVIVSPDKIYYVKALGLDGFIDDKAETIEQIAANCPDCEAWLCTRAHNLSSKHPRRVSSFNEFAAMYLQE